MQGPITVFDGGAYAGDAKIEDLPPGTERLISYALDLDTEVAPETKGHPEELLSVKFSKGTMVAARKYVRGTEYTIKNSGKAAKKVLVECPLDPNWKLTAPAKADEKTRNLYRFTVEAKPGEPAKLDVEEERTDQQVLALNNLDDNTIQFYLSAKVVSEKVKEALSEIVNRKHSIQELAVKKQQLEQHINQIGEDQNRIRQNMAQLDHQSDVYKNYIKKFSDQESAIERTREEVAKLINQTAEMQKSLDEYIMGLDVQ
jgi:DNA repair exonuclease SbcCD ATPase subunit